METVYGDELGDAVPSTHVLLHPIDDALPRAPYPVAGQSGLPDAMTLTASSSSTTVRSTVTSYWRARRSVSRIGLLEDNSEGDSHQELVWAGKITSTRTFPSSGQSRKVAPQVLQTTRVPGTTGSASDMVAKTTRERLELRKKIRELIQAGRTASTPASARATSRKASPRQRTHVEEEQAVSVVVVLQSM